jgi:hypothetical protein
MQIFGEMQIKMRDLTQKELFKEFLVAKSLVSAIIKVCREPSWWF